MFEVTQWLSSRAWSRVSHGPIPRHHHKSTPCCPLLSLAAKASPPQPTPRLASLGSHTVAGFHSLACPPAVVHMVPSTWSSSLHLCLPKFNQSPQGLAQCQFLHEPPRPLPGAAPSSFHPPGCFASTPVLGPLLSPVLIRGVSYPELQTASPLGASPPRTVLARRGAHKIASPFDVPHALLLLTTMATIDRAPPASPAPVLSHPHLPGPA